MSKYGGYSHIKLTLDQVLETIDEIFETERAVILRQQGDEGEDKLSYTVGRIQGIHRVLKKIEAAFGVIQ